MPTEVKPRTITKVRSTAALETAVEGIAISLRFLNTPIRKARKAYLFNKRSIEKVNACNVIRECSECQQSEGARKWLTMSLPSDLCDEHRHLHTLVTRH